MRFGSQEVIRRIALVSSRQPRGVLAPGEQHFRHFGEARSRQMHTQPEVIILRPAMVLITTDLLDPCPADSDRWVSKRAFDKYLAGDPLRRHQTIEPFDVKLEPLTHLICGKTFHQATDQGHIWRNIHPALVWVYYVCVLAALWGTLQAYPEIYCRVTHEFWAAIWPRHTVPYRRLQIGICAYVFATAVPLVWSDIQFSTITAIVAFLATNAGVAVVMLAALYLDFQLPPLYRTRWWMLTAGVAAAVILVAVSCISGWELVRTIAAS